MKRYRFSLYAMIAPTVTDANLFVQYGSELPPGARLLPPCAPSKIVCVGRNYPEHARELGNEPPKEPLIFLKPPSSLIASGDSIVYPALSERVDFEGELGVIIGKRARHVKTADAASYVLGYTCVNDVTARDLQKKDGQWTRGKGFDTFCAVGPSMTPREDVDEATLTVRTYVDGEKKQEAPVSEMMFSVDAIISYVSEFMTLEPGDLIATGTPPGVGPLRPGSQVRVEIDGVGVLENAVIGGET
ncbi:MAG: fumarylacetoacetate hydrolase family protein [Bryobacteraceae bacterium]|jgi:2-keto-4-pentenoate hydratase/2-oxohepta-3-ene-1,7-dioic acid hydratase in catechol pathway